MTPIKFIPALAVSLLFTIQVQAQISKAKYSWENLPRIERPVFKADTFNIIRYGAKSDGVTINTESINKAIDDCSNRGGGVVLIPQGVWLTGPVVLKSNVNLHLTPAALLQFTADKSQYKLVEGFYEGRKAIRNESPISGTNLINIAITGSGVIDGHGDVWRAMGKGRVTDSEWKNMIKTGVVSADGATWYPSESYALGAKNKESNSIDPAKSLKDYEPFKDYYRPNMVVLTNCKKVLLQNTTFQNSPAWNLHTLLCENLTFDGVKVRNEPNAQNGDGMDIESCQYVMVENSMVDCGDDAICIKSGKDEEGRKRGKPTAYVVVRNNVVYEGHGGFVIGSEMSGGAHDIFVTDCSFIGTDNGLRFKTVRGRGGVVENIFIKNIGMHNIKGYGILFDMYYFTKTPTLAQTNGKVDIPAVNEGTPQFRNFYINNLTCEGAQTGMIIRGLPERSIENINIENVHIVANRGTDVVEAKGVLLKNVTFQCANTKPLVNIENSKEVIFENVKSLGKPALFYSVNGDRSGNIKVKNGNSATASTEVDFNYGANKSALIVSK